MPLYLKDKLVSGTGAPGKSAYQTAVEAGYVGSEAEFNEALTDIPGHITNTDNPHNVTATQVGAYSKAESDTLLAGKAPAGFGFGEVLTAVQVTSSSETYEQFCEKVDAVLAAMPDGTAMLVRAYPPEKYGYANADISILYKYNSDWALLKSIGSSDKGLNGWRMIKYKKNSSDVSGTWDPFEWDNPPMKLDKIYRTTERYNTQPIYKKIDSDGIRWWSLDQVNWKVEAEGSGSYTRTEADTLLNNKAPSGYGGFGETLLYITAGNNDTDGSKFDALIEAKFATLSDNTTLQLRFDCYPAVSGSIFFGTLWKSSDNYGVLTGWSYSGEIVRKVKSGGVWLPFEWVNPLMQLGPEYRTTERYKGKPVYVKIIEAGFNPAGKVKTTSDKTVSASGLVRFSAVSGAWSFPSFMYGGNYTDDGDIQVAVQATSDGIHVFTWSKIRDMTSRTANVSVYYTKD